MSDSPWHAGEQEMQNRIGVKEQLAAVGHKIVRTVMSDQLRAFFPKLPFVVLGSVSSEGSCWAGLRFGEPGFVSSPEPKTLLIKGGRDDQDPVERGLKLGESVAVLGIELGTRRRNRVNGKIRRVEGDTLEIEVAEAFGNCPQYIQVREMTYRKTESVKAEIVMNLDLEARRQIESTDTFFVASYAGSAENRKVDISHRGGRPGFVKAESDGSLIIPDFSGNRFFMTLGNFLVEPRASLVFPDFQSGAILHLCGTAEVLSDGEAGEVTGAERYWRFKPNQIIRRQSAIPYQFHLKDWSPHTLATGIWERP